MVRSAEMSSYSGDAVRGKALTPAERTGAIRAGWNDAAWSRPRRAIPGRLARLYELGCRGGLIFRRRTLDRR